VAQERKKRRIVLASILKPVDDTRMLAKMGRSIAATGLYDVFIVGYPSQAAPQVTGIQFRALPSFPRLSLMRAMSKWTVFRMLWDIGPDILIFSTHELIVPAVLLKVLRNTSIVYDVQENYYRNILYGGSFTPVLRWFLAASVRLKEKLLAPSIDHFFLAERAYENEFNFFRGGWTLLENKAPLMPGHTRKNITGPVRLLFTGTLSEGTGVFRAIDLAKGLHHLDSTVTLTIVGFAAVDEVYHQVRAACADADFITLIGGNHLVPHHTILEQIVIADAGIIAYPDSILTRDSYPTKLFEYLQAQLPILVEPHWPWIPHFELSTPFVYTDFSNPNYAEVLRGLRTGSFYPSAPQNVSWQSEEDKFLKAIANL
jgi:hypothetical protein